MAGRLTACKEVTVCDLEGVLERWFTARACRDLGATLQQMRQSITWKTSPRPSTLADFSDLFGMIVKHAPSGVLPAKKLSLAIMACHRSRPVNFTHMDLQTFADETSGLIRAGMGKFRQLKQDADAHRRCFAKVIGADVTN